MENKKKNTMALATALMAATLGLGTGRELHDSVLEKSLFTGEKVNRKPETKERNRERNRKAQAAAKKRRKR